MKIEVNKIRDKFSNLVAGEVFLKGSGYFMKVDSNGTSQNKCLAVNIEDGKLYYFHDDTVVNPMPYAVMTELAPWQMPVPKKEQIMDKE